jgi:hypothetical protein
MAKIIAQTVQVLPGHLYRVVYLDHAGNNRKYRKVFHARILGYSDDGHEVSFDSRPIAGTGVLRSKDLLEVSRSIFSKPSLPKSLGPASPTDVESAGGITLRFK